MAHDAFMIFCTLQGHILIYPPSRTRTPHLSPSLPLLPGANGLTGQEIRGMCQPVVLNKHIFYFFSYSSRPFLSPVLEAKPILYPLHKERDVVTFVGDGECKKGREWTSYTL